MSLGTPRALALAATALLVIAAGPAGASAVSKTLPFEADRWYSLDDAKDGPITLHRIQIVRQTGLLTKSHLFRPGNAEYLVSIEIRLEYSNASTHDWKGRFRLALLDEDDREIDGYNGSEDLNEGEGHGIATVKLSTLKYGLERARRLRVAIDVEPD